MRHSRIITAFLGLIVLSVVLVTGCSSEDSDEGAGQKAAAAPKPGAAIGVAPDARVAREYMRKPCSLWTTSSPGPV